MIMPKRLISVIIPARCEAGSIARILSAVRKQKVLGATVEVCVGDDQFSRSAAEWFLRIY
jgi:hypothetical protein